MKVLFIATAYKRFKGDIITPWLVELIKKLRRQGIDISVYTSSHQGLGNQIVDDVPVYRFRYFLKKFERLTHEETAVDRIQRGPLYIFLTLFYVCFGTLSIVRVIRKEHFDVVHVHWPFPHLLFGVCAKYLGHTRLFTTFYGVEVRWLKQKFRFLVKPFSLLLTKADTITAISTHTARELEGMTTKHIAIIPFSAAVQPKGGAATDERSIIFVGRLVERKGVKYLIEAFARIRNDIPHNLVIISDGPERPALETLAHTFELGTRITFTGRISDKELHKHYEQCSFLVLPAVYDAKGDIEGLGVVLIEAMSYSKPVIASHAGGITDIVDDGVNGFLVPPRDVGALAQRMKELALKDSLRKAMGEKAKQSIDEKFNWDTIVQKLITLYKAGEK